MRFSAVVSLAALVAAASSSSVGSPSALTTPKTQDVATKCRPKGHKKPNFVVFLTDDQDHLMDSLSYQQYVKKHFLDEGTRFTHYYTTSATCCPSRVSLWLGTFAHNHNVTDESRPHGSYYKFQANHLDDDWLPLWLQDAGYSNHYIGKFINGVDLNNTVAPKGWEHFEPLVSPGIYNFTNPIFSLNGGPVEEHPGVYQTDLILNKSLARIDKIAKKDDPFLFVISPTAPHDEIQTNGQFTPPRPAERHKHLFPNAKVPRTPNFNPAKQDKVGWIKDLPLLTSLQIDEIDHHYRQRLRSLQATDELVDSVIKKLKEKN
ncbi:alkaline phosphatase-like protein, partial [Martensiomyces pterosporus]